MLARHIIGYMPSLAVPAATSFISIFCYTRLLTTGEYGHYALTLSGMTLINLVFFYWLQMSLTRLMPQAIHDGYASQLRATSLIAFAAIGAVLIACVALLTGLIPLGDLAQVAWLAVPLALARSLLNLNQTFHRSNLDFKRYNIVECGQSVLGLGLGLALVWFFHLGNNGAIIGMIIGMSCMTLVDRRELLSLSLASFSRPLLMDIVRFGLPMALSCGLAFIISSSDRFLIEHFRSAAEVGIYAAGYSLMDRIMQTIFMVVATPSFPLLVHKLEHEGVEAARAQTYQNGVAALALALPACAGLILVMHPLASVLIGSDFRDGALQVMPWIALSTLLSGLSAHYFDHAFFLAKKPRLLLYTQGPAALLNLALNLIWIPQYGYLGAAYSTTLSYALLMTLSICIGRRIFAIRFPFKPALQIAGAVALMAAALKAFSFPDTLPGLIAMLLIGGAVYALAILAFNVMDARRRLLRLLRR